ncbi:hypothetical protein [Streptomyces sp. NRRL S-237]|uniref:hypothetical protein n=1 Tax=Streptomyces sp. NRRL S-237 TaxID=1463895 RepID=UPI000A490B9B|nr:hypothetical protein [Streptomyces sp. NRRL S-237]
MTLPLEAIQLDSFRKRHEQETFWCGLLLGGCGVQLTTKLYTDRVCHFAHHPGTDGLCGRRARGVASADHLYVKAAAAAWLRTAGHPGDLVDFDFDFARPDGAEIGSVLDIRFKERGLRVHLDQTVAPVWDEDGREPVLGVSVPVDRDTLIDRWYIHRIRLDSVGTSRQVRIGTEAFMRPTEWFELEECEMTGRGLTTPAVERLVQSRSTRPVSRRATGQARKAPDPRARVELLLRKLAEAQKPGSVFVVTQTSGEIAAVTGLDEQGQAQARAAVAGPRSGEGAGRGPRAVVRQPSRGCRGTRCRGAAHVVGDDERDRESRSHWRGDCYRRCGRCTAGCRCAGAARGDHGG